MKKRVYLLRLVLLGAAMVASPIIVKSAGNGPTVNSVQSTARPLNLTVAGSVYTAGSDARSLDFQNNFLPLATSVMNQFTHEGSRFQQASGFRLDPSRLFLVSASDLSVRVYFVSAICGYNNSIPYSNTSAGNTNQALKLVFPNAKTGSGNRAQATPLKPGDFVDLGIGAAQTQFDFTIISNGANGGTQVLYNSASKNSDGVSHCVVFPVQSSRYLVIGYEDMIGGDYDYNDVVIVVDIGANNAAALTATSSSLPN